MDKMVRPNYAKLGSGTMQSYVPDQLDSLSYWMAATFYGDNREGVAKAQKLLNFGEMTPLAIGAAPFHGADSIQRLSEGRYAEAGIAATNALLSTPIPALAAFKAVKHAPAAGKMLRALNDDVSGTFMYGSADTFPHEQAKIANKLIKSGYDLEQIFDKTGVFPDVVARKALEEGKSLADIGDIRWVKEIDDTGARFNTSSDKVPENLGQYMDHPELYAAYPELKDLPLKWQRGEGGSYNPQRTWREESPITIGTGDAIDTTIHETAHAIQNIEGASRGASTRSLNPAAAKLFNQELSKRQALVTEEEAFFSKFGRSIMTNADKEHAIILAKKHNSEIKDYIFSVSADTPRKVLLEQMAQTGYKNAAGEVEANNAMNRRVRQLALKNGKKSTKDNAEWIKAETEKLHYPWKTENIQAKNQLIDPEFARGRRPLDLAAKQDEAIADSSWMDELERQNLTKQHKLNLKRRNTGEKQ